MKLKFVKMLQCSDGSAKATVPEWQCFEVFQILAKWKDQHADSLEPDKFNALVDTVLENSDALIHILSQREKGRPAGAKDKAPRKSRKTPATTSDLDGAQGGGQ